MRIAIHQPNYLPFWGYFHKMAHCDVFVFLDHVPFTKGGYQNRVRIQGKGDPLWLTEPVLTKGKLGESTLDIQFNGHDWVKKHLDTLRARYGRSPHFASVYPLLENWLSLADTNLSRTNASILRSMARHFGISCEFRNSHQLRSPASGSDLILSLCKDLQATSYLSGHGGKNYLVESDFTDAGIPILYPTEPQPPHPQFTKDFVPGLSIIDALFFQGNDLATYVRGGAY